MSEDSVRTSYDDLPYPSYPYAYTHPDHLATIATLLGMEPASADHCRVLELGCAAGGNLIPLALSLPDSAFVGIDLSAAQIAQGQKMVADLGLKNIDLRQVSIVDVDETFGQFDYIICHGVFSWVPRPVQDALLQAYARHLAPNGIGYVSYNTYPGWHMRGTIRAMMMHHVKRFQDQSPAHQVEEARALLNFLAQSVPQKNSPYSLLLREHLDLLKNCADAYLFHEHLEEWNDPIYFTDFCERLTAQGLRYLGEAEFQVMVPASSFPPHVHEMLSRLAPNLIDMEQYMDFLRNRLFRQTLVCHEHVRPNYKIRGERLELFHVASPTRPISAAPDLVSEAVEEFKGFNDLVLTATAPVVKAAMVCLSEAWPGAIAFDKLRSAARARLNGGAADDSAQAAQAAQPALAREDAQVLAKALLTAYAGAGHSLLELWLRPPAFASGVSARPVASALARLQAQTTQHVTNLRHEVVKVAAINRQLLQLLDGSRDRHELLQGLRERHEQGNFQISANDELITDSAHIVEILNQILDQELPRLAREALLIS